MHSREKIFPFIENRGNFLLGEIPNHHPSSINYLKFWKEQKKRCIEGHWNIDSEHSTGNVWRWMPGNLYFYVNFGTILHKPEGSARTAAKKRIRPYLRDMEWAFFYNYMEARGFSGFVDDDVYTSCKDIELYESGFLVYENIHSSCFNNKGELKEFIDPRDYIRKKRDRSYGKPLFFNEANNLILIGSRGGGKSYLSAVGCVLYEVLFDSAKEYTQDNIINPAVAEVFVGSAISSKSSDLLSKTLDAYLNLPGVWAKGTEEEVPSPLYKDMAGSLRPNNMKTPWRHEYEKKVAGKWNKFGSGSHVYHGIWTTENPEAAAGTRPGLIVIEECGLVPNMLTIMGCFAKGTMVRMYDGTRKAVENIIVGDTLIGHDGNKRTVGELYHGVDDMYKISQANGVDYTVNSKHRLYLEQYRGTKTDGLKTISAEDWFNLDIANSRRDHTYGLKSGELEFDNTKLDLDPYFMGLYIGDGLVRTAGVCYDPKTDKNTEEWLISYYETLGLSYSLRDIKGALLCSPIGKRGKANSNYIRNKLREYNTYDKKYLHKDFLFASKNDRLKLLAGLIDSDGTLTKRRSGYEYVFYQSGRDDLVDKVEFLARSLGFRVSHCIHYDKRKAHYKHRHQLTITGDIYLIPCRHERKKVKYIDKKYKRSTVRSAIHIDKIGVDNYYGFKLVEDDKFLLADNTIVFNSNDACQMTDGTDKFGTSLLVGTGGNMEKIIETEIIFRDPTGFSFLSFDDEWEGSGKMGWFVPATYMDGRFKDKNGNTILHEAVENYEDRRKKKKKARSKTAIDIEMMNYPLVPSEMFLNVGNNRFPVSDIKQRYSELMSNKSILDATWKGKFILSEGKVKWKNGNDLPIYEYPTKDNEDIHGAVHIFEMPKKNADGIVPSGAYIAGFDPVDDDDDDRDNSLQSFFIMNILTGRLVLEFSARTRYASEFYEQVRRSLLYYNATVNYENQKKGFYGYMKNKVGLHMLADTPEILKDMDMQRINTTGNKSKGTSANLHVNNWGLELQLEWLEEQAYGYDDGVMNLNLIKSPAYLRELILFDGKRNTDRVSAIGMLLLYRQEKLRLIQSSRANYDNDATSFSDNILEGMKKRRNSYSYQQESYKKARKLFAGM
jgi:hypothetical protein